MKKLFITAAQFILMQKAQEETLGFDSTVTSFIDDHKDNFSQEGMELELEEGDKTDLVDMLKEFAEQEETQEEDKTAVNTWVAELEKTEEPEAKTTEEAAENQAGADDK